MTRDEFDAAGRALRGRSTEELASFVETLLLDSTAGVGDYVRAFAAEDCDGAVRVIGRSISRWRGQHKHDTYHQADACAQRLDWTLEAIDRCVRPLDPPAALGLLVQFFEADEDLGPATQLGLPVKADSVGTFRVMVAGQPAALQDGEQAINFMLSNTVSGEHTVYRSLFMGPGAKLR